jgi:uncharacterized protein DUF6188
MYGLRSDIDLNFLIGREVIQIAIGVYQIIFAFDEDTTLSVEAEFLYSDGRTESTWKPGASHIAASTVSLLGATVVSFERNESGTLELLFSNGHRLVVRDSSKEFESYHITRPGETIVV